VTGLSAGAERPRRHADGRDPSDRSRRANDSEARAFALRFFEALRSGDAKFAERIAEEALSAGFDASVVHCRVIAPAMESIGELWACGSLTPADEHLATAITHGVLARLFPRLLRTTMRSRERVMLAAAEGEHHVLGLRIVADTLEGAGFDVLYLGADVPLEALLEACRKHRPAVLCLGATMPLNAPTLLAELVELAKLEEPPLLIVGGRAIGAELETKLRVPVVRRSEDVIAEIERVLVSGPQGPPLEQELAERIPLAASAELAGAADIGTIPDHFSATALASADTARDASRRAHELEQLAFRDPLTGTWNRRAFDDRFGELANQSAKLALLMVDVDRFKTINDTLGHEAGDSTLVKVAKTIVQNVRPADFAARYGGDEFIVLLPETKLSDARVVAERVRRGVCDELREPPVTVSIGVAAFSGDQRRTGLTVDQALYRAKARGRNRVASGRG
jgi:diguanylate cyclase (GGDEF)-like protein